MMKILCTIILCIAIAATGGVSASAHTELHLSHDADILEEKHADGSRSLHETLYPHDAQHQSSHDDDDRDADHDSEDHASHSHGCAIISSLTPFSDNAWNEALKAFEADLLLPDPLYLAEHVPD